MTDVYEVLWRAVGRHTRGIVFLSESYLNNAEGFAKTYPGVVVVVLAGGIFANLRVFGKHNFTTDDLVAAFR